MMFKIKRAVSLIMIGMLCVFTAACGPSEEKVMQAQQKYIELKQKHNQVVEAHSIVNSNVYDEQLLALRAKIDEVEAYNLNDMEDEEIDLLIEIMDSLIASYDEFQVVLTEAKTEEEASVIVTLPITVVNQTGKAISSLRLYEKDDVQESVNVLENLTPLENGQTIVGLVVHRDIDNTPWMLEIICTEASEETKGAETEVITDKEIALELLVGEYQEDGKVLTLVYDEEAATVVLAEEVEVSEETAENKTEE